jgi:hypothetical protein
MSEDRDFIKELEACITEVEVINLYQDFQETVGRIQSRLEEIETLKIDLDNEQDDLLRKLPKANFYGRGTMKKDEFAAKLGSIRFDELSH